MTDARQVLGDQYDAVLDLIDRAGHGDDVTGELVERFGKLEQMVMQELYYRVESKLPDGEALEAKRRDEREAVIDQVIVVTELEDADERAAAAKRARASLEQRRKLDVDELLPRLAEAGVDLDRLGTLMRKHAG